MPKNEVGLILQLVFLKTYPLYSLTLIYVISYCKVMHRYIAV